MGGPRPGKRGLRLGEVRNSRGFVGGDSRERIKRTVFGLYDAIKIELRSKLIKPGVQKIVFASAVIWLSLAASMS